MWGNPWGSGSGDISTEERDAPRGSPPDAYGTWHVCGACGWEWQVEVIRHGTDVEIIERDGWGQVQRTYGTVPGGDPERFVWDADDIVLVDDLPAERFIGDGNDLVWEGEDG